MLLIEIYFFYIGNYDLTQERNYINLGWHTLRLWNGDALYHIVLPPECAVLRIKLKRISSTNKLQMAPNFEK